MNKIWGIIAALAITFGVAAIFNSYAKSTQKDMTPEEKKLSDEESAKRARDIFGFTHYINKPK